MEVYFTQYDYKRLEQYALNLVDYHLIMDLVPNMAKLFYLNKLGQDFSVSAVQSAILLGLGLQYKSIESLEKDLQLPSNQLLALFNKVVKKFISLIEEINVTELSKGFKNDNLQVQTDRVRGMVALKQSLDDELNEEAEKVLKNEKEEKKANILQLNDLKKYEIKANDSDWSDALKINTGKSSSYVSVKRLVSMAPRG
jgi:N-acetyltransferase 10